MLTIRDAAAGRRQLLEDELKRAVSSENDVIQTNIFHGTFQSIKKKEFIKKLKKELQVFLF